MAWTIAAIVAVSVAGAAPAQESAAAADIVLRGGRVITLDPADRVAEAVAIRGNRIVAVGSGAEMAALVGPRTRVVELAGRAVVPGFIDAHCHVEHTARFRHFYLDLHSPPLPAGSAAVLEAVRRRAAELPPGAWIVGQGTYGTAMPARDELDRAVPDHPVALRWSVHDVLVNRKALELAGIDRSTPDPPGGKIERGPDGEPTGILREAFDLLPIPPYDPPRLREALRDTLQQVFLEQGVTTAYELPASAAGVAAYQDLERAASCRSVSSSASLSRPAPAARRSRHPPRHRAAHRVRQRSPPHRPDQDLRRRLGSFRRHLPADQPGLLMRSGETLASEVFALIAPAGSSGSTPSAIARRTWRSTLWSPPRDGAARRSSAPHRAPRERLARAGNRAGEETRRHSGPDRGLPVAGSGRDRARGRPTALPVPHAARPRIPPPGNADTAGTQTFAINPMFSLSREVLRTNWNGVPVSPREAVSITEALRIHTLYAAHAGFEEKEKGSIEPGSSPTSRFCRWTRSRRRRSDSWRSEST